MATSVGVGVCYRVDIIGDDVCEESELFSVTLTSANPLDMIAGSDEAEVTILDDGDSECVCV